MLVCRLGNGTAAWRLLVGERSRDSAVIGGSKRNRLRNITRFLFYIGTWKYIIVYTLYGESRSSSRKTEMAWIYMHIRVSGASVMHPSKLIVSKALKIFCCQSANPNYGSRNEHLRKQILHPQFHTFNIIIISKSASSSTGRRRLASHEDFLMKEIAHSQDEVSIKSAEISSSLAEKGGRSETSRDDGSDEFSGRQLPQTGDAGLLNILRHDQRTI